MHAEPNAPSVTCFPRVVAEVMERHEELRACADQYPAVRGLKPRLIDGTS